MKPQTPYQFFLKHAGFSYGLGETPEQGRRRCARTLAKAEKEARDGDFTFHWSVDQATDSSDFSDDEPPWQVWMCTMRNADGDVCASLHGIDFGRHAEPWGNPYRRVVEAELASEGVTAEPQGRSDTYWHSEPA